MRRRVLWLGLTAAWACGGDGNSVGGPIVSDPPPKVSITVQSQGSGSGHVGGVGSGGPDLDCAAMPSEVPTTLCSADYHLAATVFLTATPASGSVFGGWSGDAATCELFDCPLYMGRPLNVVARFDAPRAHITTSTWRAEPDLGLHGVVIYALEVQNTSDETLERVRIDFATRKSTGEISNSNFTFIGPIPPQETRATENTAGHSGLEATAEFHLTQIDVAEGGNPLAGVEIVSSDWRVDPEFRPGGSIIWTAEVQNNTSSVLEYVRIAFSTFDANGKILTAGLSFVDNLQPGARGATESFTDYFGTEATAKFHVGEVQVSATARQDARVGMSARLVVP